MSAPYVAGVAAQPLSEHPQWIPAQVHAAIVGDATHRSGAAPMVIRWSSDNQAQRYADDRSDPVVCRSVQPPF
jgi:hypothetical protein